MVNLTEQLHFLLNSASFPLIPIFPISLTIKTNLPLFLCFDSLVERLGGGGEHGTKLVPVIRINIGREHKTSHNRGQKNNYSTALEAAEATGQLPQNALAELISFFHYS